LHIAATEPIPTAAGGARTVPASRCVATCGLGMIGPSQPSAGLCIPSCSRSYDGAAKVPGRGPGPVSRCRGLPRRPRYLLCLPGAGPGGPGRRGVAELV